MQVVGFALSIVLARLLEPEEFGTVALLTIFLALAGTFIDGGFGAALIQKKDADELDFNSIFYFTLGIALALYALLWVSAGWIAAFYSKPVLIPVMRWQALSIILNAVNGIQNAVLSREMKFKVSFYSSLTGILAQGAIGISLAYYGYGIWALVYSSLGSSLLSTVVRGFLIGWHPSLMFSFQRVKNLFWFGSRMLVSCLLDTFFNQIYGLLIGRWYSAAELAYFNRGDAIPNMAMNSVQGVIGSVMFPALSKLQHDVKTLKAVTRRIMTFSSFLVFPVMFGMAAVAKPLVLLLLTEKWLPVVPFLQLACISYAFWPIHVANLQAIQACGRSDIFLKLEIAKKVLVILSILATFKYGVLALAWGRVALGPLCIIINALPCGTLIGYPVGEQAKDLLPSLALAGAMGCLVASVAWLPLGFYGGMVVQVVTGTLAYLGVAYLFRMNALMYGLDHLRAIAQRKAL